MQLDHCEMVKSKSAKSLLGVIKTVLAKERAIGHEVRRIQVDGDSTSSHEHSELVTACAAEGIELIRGAGGHHQAIGQLEVTQGHNLRKAEQMLYRTNGKYGPSALLLARRQEVWLRNRTPMSDGGASPLQRHTGTADDVSRFNGRGGVPIFGCDVTYHIDEVGRPVKGSARYRAATGSFLFIDGDKYYLESDSHRLISRHAVTPINENTLARTGISAGSASVEAGTQMEQSDMPPLQLLPTKQKEKPTTVTETKIVTDKDEVPAGSKLAVWWPGKAGFADGAWYRGDVLRVVVCDDGEVQHLIKYEGWDGEYRHDLAKDKATGRLPWAFAPPPKAPPPPKPPPPAPTHKYSFRPRNHIDLNMAAAALLQQIEQCRQPVMMTNQIAFQITGDADRELTRDKTIPEYVDETMDMTEFASKNALTCSKVKQTVVDVEDDNGELYQIMAPKTTKQIKEHKHAEQIIAADQEAIEVAILGFEGNDMVSITTVPKGEKVEDTVMDRRIKTNNRKLDKFKSRLAVDGGKKKRRLAKQRMVSPIPTYATPANPQVKFSALAASTEAGEAPSSAKHLAGEEGKMGKTTAKGDVGNAYPKARTARGYRYMRVPLHLRTYDSEGNEMVIRIGSPMWGEHEAGHEWDVEFAAFRISIGWERCDGVPGLWIYRFTDDDSEERHSNMISEVDDFVIIEDAINEYAVTARTIYLTNEKYRNPDGSDGVKWELQPAQYAGLELAFSKELLRVTLRQEQKVVELARRHVAALLDVTPTPTAKQLGLKSGGQLRRALDAQRAKWKPTKATTDEERKARAVRAKPLQEAVGGLRYVANTQPGLELALNLLSATQSDPLPEGYELSKGVIVHAYEERHKGITYGGERARAVKRPEVSIGSELRTTDGTKDLGHGAASNVKLHDGAPTKTETHADATWNKLYVPEELKDVDLDALIAALDDIGVEELRARAAGDTYGIIMTKQGASILHKTKAIGTVTGSSQHAEYHASVKASEHIEFQAAIDEGLHNRIPEPILLTTDNSANQNVIHGESSATRSRHLLRKYLEIQQRATDGILYVRYVESKENPADFLTKWLAKEQYDSSIEYATNSRAAVDATSEETRAWAAECMTKQMKSCKALAKGKLLKSMADFESSEA